MDEDHIDERHAATLLQTFRSFLKSVSGLGINGDRNATAIIAGYSNFDAGHIDKLVEDVLNITPGFFECGDYAGNHFLTLMNRLG